MPAGCVVVAGKRMPHQATQIKSFHPTPVFLSCIYQAAPQTSGPADHRYNLEMPGCKNFRPGAPGIQSNGLPGGFHLPHAGNTAACLNHTQSILSNLKACRLSGRGKIFHTVVPNIADGFSDPLMLPHNSLPACLDVWFALQRVAHQAAWTCSPARL